MAELVLNVDEAGEDLEMEVPYTIMSLPREVRGIIYSKLPQGERVNLRLVCSQWRTEVDELCTFSAQINDENQNWERVFQLRLHACEVVHFLKPPPNGVGTRYLKFPNLLQTLKMETENISADNFYYLLSDSAGSITDLYLQVHPPLLGKRFETSLTNFGFHHLINFELTVPILPQVVQSNGNGDEPILPFPVGSPDSSEEILYTQLVANRTMVNLRHLKLGLNVVGKGQVSKMTASALQLISSRWKTLKSLDYELIQGHGMPSTEFQPLNDLDIERIDLNLMKKLVQLESLRIVSSSPIGVNYWIDIIENQGKLKYFESDLLPVSSSVFQRVVLRNANSLVICEITDLTIWNEDHEVQPFDVSAFQECNNLKKLILDRNVIARRQYECPELLNLYTLPESLEELAINYFNVLSVDFILLFNAPGGLNLKSLTLNQCGSSGDYGPNGTVIEHIVSLPFIIFIEISPLNFSDPEESQKLNQILISYGYSEGHSYFQLSKLETALVYAELALVGMEDYNDND